MARSQFSHTSMHCNGLSDELNETRVLNEFAICFLAQNTLCKDISHNMDDKCGEIDKCLHIPTCTSLLTYCAECPS